MRHGDPIDLEELLLRCRSDTAKIFLSEAVASYRAGAYRASIVSTWTSVVYDYLDKLREMEVAGVSEAKLVLEAFDKARRDGDVTASLRLEHDVIDNCKKFDLLTPLETTDLERLRVDRNRCAHPSLQTIEDPYMPTAELARLHIRNSVELLMSRPPVQGNEAWRRIWGDVSSEYFPEDLNQSSRFGIDRARG